MLPTPQTMFRLIAILVCFLSFNNGLKIYIIGSSGVLGTALLKHTCSLPHTNIFPSFRSLQKFHEAEFTSLIHVTSRVSPFLLTSWDENVLQPHPLPQLEESVANDDHILLINNAGVYLEGHSAEVLSESMKVNALLPMATMEIMLQKSRQYPLTKFTVINVSSGDGERVYLNSEIISAMEEIQTIHRLKNYIYEELMSQYRANFEYAFGSTPFYSLSKALLNKATQLYDSDSPPNMRVISCCPGNFLSPMTTADEIDSLLSPETAAAYVMQVGLEYEKFSGGKFYRYGQEIAW